MYASVVDELIVKMPFSNFEIQLLEVLHLAPTQLHPNGWAFAKAFERFCRVRNLFCSVRVFLHMFRPYHPVFEKDSGKKYWVSLHGKQKYQIFKLFVDSWKDWKSSYFRYSFNGRGACWFKNSEGNPLFPLRWGLGFFDKANRAGMQFPTNSLSAMEDPTTIAVKEFVENKGTILCKDMFKVST